MRAIRFKAFGDPSVLELAEVADPPSVRRQHWCGSWRPRLGPADFYHNESRLCGPGRTAAAGITELGYA
jgi:hypothetical protein